MRDNNDLDKKSFTEIVKRDEVYFSVDARQDGMGGASCGPGVLPAYVLKIKDMVYTYRISLVNKNTDMSSAMSESPFLASPTILPQERMIYKGDNNIEIVSPVRGAEIRYTLDGNEPHESSPLHLYLSLQTVWFRLKHTRRAKTHRYPFHIPIISGSCYTKALLLNMATLPWPARLRSRDSHPSVY